MAGSAAGRAMNPGRQPVARVGPLMGAPALLRELGCAPAPVLERAGLSADGLQDPEETIPYSTAGALLAGCAEASACPHFALLLGSRVHPWALGLPGLLLHTATRVAGALRAFIDHISLQDRGGMLTLESGGAVATMSFSIFADVPGAAHIYDFSAALGCSIMRGLCGSDWNPSQVLLARRRPIDQRPYVNFFRARLLYDGDHAAVAFHARWLEHPVPLQDALLSSHVTSTADEQVAALNVGFRERLAPLLRALMTQGDASAAAAARRLGTHERTLNRKLQAEGTTFAAELQAVRHAVASQLLCDTSLPIPEIACALGYASAGSFSRAFKRWSGRTPASVRGGRRSETVAGSFVRRGHFSNSVARVCACCSRWRERFQQSFA